MIKLTPKEDQAKALDTIKKWYTKDKYKRSDYLVLSGYAGTGKSTLLRWLQDQLNLRFGDIIFTSFTGKATNVLKQNNLRAKTLHRLLYDSKFDKKTGTYYSTLKDIGIEEGLVVVDEASMVSEKLFKDLMRIIGDFKIIFVGDNAQLPPVNSEFNIMENPHIQLTKVLRQAALNPIIRLATDIRQNKPWKIDTVLNGDIGYMPATNEAVEKAIERYFANDVFLCSTNKDRVIINKEIREQIQSTKRQKESLICKNDRLIVLDNCSKQGVFNGQLFTVEKYKNNTKHSINVFGVEGDGEPIRVVIHPYAFLNEKGADRFEICKKYALDWKTIGVSCDYAYCLTVHKSQGSEFECVFLQLSQNDRRIWKDLYNRWLYTAITRASKNLYFLE